MITPEDYQIVLKLESNPLISHSELAGALGVSWPTAKRKLNDLRSRGIIKTPVAIYNIRNLGLERVTVIWLLKSIDNLKLMEKFCDIHPYTHYRGRGYGNGFFLFTQFDIPIEIIPLMKELCMVLEREKYVNRTEFLQSSGYQIETFPDLNFYNLEKNKWNFNWIEWQNQVDDQSDVLPKLNPPKLRLQEWTAIDFKILRELTKNPERKQTELMKMFKLTRTEAHNRYNCVFKHLISSIRSRFDRSLFNLINTRLFWIFTNDREKIYQFFNLMDTIPPPFRLGMDILQQNGFILWGGGLQNFHEHQLAISIWKLFQTFNSYTLDTSVDASMIYWFYPENFDFNLHYWKTDRAYVLEKPLEELKQL